MALGAGLLYFLQNLYISRPCSGPHQGSPTLPGLSFGHSGAHSSGSCPFCSPGGISLPYSTSPSRPPALPHFHSEPSRAPPCSRAFWGNPITEHPLSHSPTPPTPTLDFPGTALTPPWKPLPVPEGQPLFGSRGPTFILAPPSDSPWACDRVRTASTSRSRPRMTEGLPTVCGLPEGGEKEGRGRG